MSAEGFQMRLARCQGCIHVDSRHTTGRTLSKAIFGGNQDHRAVVFNHQSRGNDAQHAGVPSLPVQHQRAALEQRGIAIQMTLNVRQDCLLQFLPFTIQKVKGLGGLGGSRDIACGQQIHRS